MNEWMSVWMCMCEKEKKGEKKEMERTEKERDSVSKIMYL